MEIEAVKHSVAEIVKTELAKLLPEDGIAYQAFFFGSRIAGTASERSDLDVGIEGVKPLSSETLRSIRARCEALKTLYTIDIVDFSNTSEEFKKVAKLHLESIV